MSFHRLKEALLNGATPQLAAIEASLWKKNSSPPDYKPVADASAESARLMYNLGQNELAFAKQQYNEVKPIATQIANAQLGAMNQQYTQGEDYYKYQTDTFRPLEKQMVADAANFNTKAYRDQRASQAAADAGLAFNQTRAANERAMASMGVNPNSGKYQALANQSALGLAANRSNAMNNSRQQAEQLGWARQLDAVGLGRNLPGASSAAYQSATAAGNSSGQNAAAPGAAYQGAMNAAHGTIGDGQRMQIQGLSSALNAQTQWAVADSQNGGGLGGVLGSVAGAAMMKW